MDNVLYTLCRHCTNIIDGYRPYPSTVIAKHLKISLYQVRKELKKLKQLGYVESIIESGFDDWNCQNYIMRGYHITVKATSTEEYKKAKEEEIRACKECFNIDISEI